jgi:mRNA-degrading endonuclease toxin of MazEF toxin-antitoxin module
MIDPKRGEVWLVDLNPTRGQEIQKTRPVVVLSTNVFSYSGDLRGNTDLDRRMGLLCWQ